MMMLMLTQMTSPPLLPPPLSTRVSFVRDFAWISAAEGDGAIGLGASGD